MRLNGKAVLSSAITAGLLLTTATATLAADPPAHSNAGGSDTGRTQAADGQAKAGGNQAPADATSAGGSDTGTAHSAEGQGHAGENKAAAAGRSNAGGGSGGGGGGGGGASDPTTRPGPPGNNGTIKIDGVDFDTHPNNEPHVDCIFEIDFYGFDANQRVTVSFALQSPTKDGTITGTSPSSTILDDDDNSFGGSDRGFDGSLRYTLGFTGVAPHPKQGYHVKVTVNAPGAKGADTKHKVFWVRPCGSTGGTVGKKNPTTTTTAPTTTTTVAATTTTTVATTTTTVATTTTTVAPTTTTTTTSTTIVGGTSVQNQGSTSVGNSGLAVLGAVIERSPAAQPAAAAAPAAAGVNAANAPRVLGAMLERSALARTGLNALQLLTLAALTLLAGIAAVRASRREKPAAPRFPI